MIALQIEVENRILIKTIKVYVISYQMSFGVNIWRRLLLCKLLTPY